MGDPLYAEEKLTAAVYLMATGRGNVKDRLAQAFTEFVPVSESDLPEKFRSEFRWIRQALTTKEAKQVALIEGRVVEGVEGRIGATLATMRYEKAEEIARRLVRLSDELAAHNAAA